MTRKERGKLDRKGRDGGPDIDVRRLLRYHRTCTVTRLRVVANMWSLSYVIDKDRCGFALLFLPLRVDNRPFRSERKGGIIIKGIGHVAIFAQIWWVFLAQQKLDGAFNIDAVNKSSIVAGIGDDTFQTRGWYSGKRCP